MYVFIHYHVMARQRLFGVICCGLLLCGIKLETRAKSEHVIWYVFANNIGITKRERVHCHDIFSMAFPHTN